MNVVVCIPHRGGIPERDRNFSYTYAWWQKLGWPIFVGDDESETPFSAGRSRNVAAETAGDWDVAIFTDSDMVPGGVGQVDKAVSHARKTGEYTTLHSELRYPSSAATEQICAGEIEPAKANVTKSVGGVWISSCAIRRDLWEKVGGYDSRMHGYGPDDIAFFYACSTFAGQHRTAGPMYHLDHPSVRGINDVPGTWTVFNQYSDALGDRAKMASVVNRGRLVDA